jgi:N-acetyl-gamma-glutamyl-phosphate reductase
VRRGSCSVTSTAAVDILAVGGNNTTTMSIRTAIIGPTGYTGLHLLRLLLGHPGAQITYLASRREQLPNVIDEFPELLGRLALEDGQCKPVDGQAIANDADVVFLCLPHRAAMSCAPAMLDAGLRVIDLSAAYRFADPQQYAQAYDHPHEDSANLADAVYGLPELFRAQIPGAMLVANPGCYPTPTALAVAPLLTRSLVKSTGIIVNASTGVTGAGRKPSLQLHYPEHKDAYLPYGNIGAHRHQPEMIQTLTAIVGHKVDLLFVPHLLPVERGILATIYLDPSDPEVTESDLFEAFTDAYEQEPFIRVRTDLPNIKHVHDTNFCDLTVRLTNGKVVIFAAIDNMIKGASGQAIQNMNLVFEQPETDGLL